MSYMRAYHIKFFIFPIAEWALGALIYEMERNVAGCENYEDPLPPSAADSAFEAYLFLGLVAALLSLFNNDTVNLV